MSFKSYTVIFLLLLVVPMMSFGQAIGRGGYQPSVALLGNSIAAYESGLQAYIFPQLPVSKVYIYGRISHTCQMVRLSIVADAFGTSLGPRNPDVVVLVNDTSNDISHGVPPATTYSCLEGTIGDLLNRKATLKIILLSQVPWTQYDPCTGQDNDPSYLQLIQNMNAMLPGLQAEFPHNVRVLDAYTPFLDHQGDGWGDPSLMGGPCGVHPGDPGVWDFGQPTLANVFRNIVLTSNQLW